MSVELLKKALIPHCPEIEQIEFRHSVFPEFRIKLNDQGLLSDAVASAILKAQKDVSRVLGNYSLVFIHPLRELRDSPEHLQLAELLFDSLIEVHEDGVSPRSCEPQVWFSDLVRIAPSVVSVFESCLASNTHLSLPAITELPDEIGMAFEILSVKTLDLSGLESITPGVAKGICGDGIEHLKLDGLKSISLESAKALAENFKGEEISLMGLVDPLPEILNALGCMSAYKNFSSQVRASYESYWSGAGPTFPTPDS